MWPSAVTRWPARSPVTPSPTDSISPANSWPTTIGGLTRPWAHGFQSAMWRSVPQTPACRTAIRTSPGPGDGLGTVVTFRPGPRLGFTMACMCARDAGCVKRDALEDGSREAAIYLEYCAGNIAGPFRRQKHDRGRELFRRTDPPDRRLGQPLLDHVGAGFCQLFNPLRGDESRADAVDGDAVFRALVRQCFGEAEHARTRRGREDEAGQRLQGGDRGEADDATPLRLGHDRHGGAREMDRGKEVQLDRLAPGIRRLVLERSRGGTAGIAEQHVEPAELLCDVLHQFLGLGRNRHVRGEGRRLGIAAVDCDLRALRG